MRTLIAATCLTILAASSVAMAQDAPVVSVFATSEDGARYLTYFLEDCGECGVAQFSCGNGSGVTMWLPDFDEPTLGTWLAEGGARALMRMGDVLIEFVPQQMTFSEMTGAWDVEFVAWGYDASALEPLALSEAAIIETARGEIALPAFERDSANARAFIDACLQGG